MTARPRVLVNFASSIDGKINPAPGRRVGAGVFMMSRGREDLRRMRLLRAEADAVLIGARNLRADDPDLALAADERERRRQSGRAEPLRVVVTTRGEGLSPAMKIFDPARGGAAIVVHTAAMPEPTRAALAPLTELVELGTESVDVGELLAWLATRRGVATLLCEGGGDICAQLFAARAVDRLHLTLVPRVLGGDGAPTLVGGQGFDVNEIPDAELAAVERIGDELYLRYDFTWLTPWAPRHAKGA